MTHTTLHLRHARSPPDLDGFDVKRHVERPVRGQQATLAVLGSSHYVGVPAVDYHELCSCRPIDGPRVRELCLETAIDRRVRFERADLAVETHIVSEPLSAFPGPEPAAVAYRFGPDAYTTIDVDRDGIETYHTYPEFDLALYSHTVFTRVPETRPIPIQNDD